MTSPLRKQPAVLVAPLLAALLVPMASAAALGDLVAGIQGDRLDVRGGPDADGFLVDQADLAVGSVRVTPLLGSTVNGSTDPAVFAGVARLAVDDEGGDADVSVQFCQLAKGISVRCGDGDDGFELRGGTTGKLLDLDLGAGTNSLLGSAGAVLEGRLLYAGGDGIDTLELGDSLQVTHDLKLDLGGGLNQVVLLAGVVVGGKLLASGGGGDDIVVLAQGCSIGRRVRLVLGDGNNLLQLDGGSTVDDKLDLLGGAGIDQVILTGAAEVTRDLTLSLGEGDNLVGLSSGATIGRRLTQKGGAGSDLLQAALGATVGGKLKLALGAGSNAAIVSGGATASDGLDYRGAEGDDSLLVTGLSQVLGNLTVRVGDGDNTVGLDECTLGAGVLVVGGAAGDEVTFETSEVGPGKTQLVLGDGVNVAQAFATIFHGPVRVVGGPGDDVIDFGGATVEGTFQAVGKGGLDQVTLPPPP